MFFFSHVVNLLCQGFLWGTGGAVLGPISQMINRWFPMPFTSVSCSAAQRISKPHMFLQRSRFPVWEWPPEGQTLASSSSSCYLEVKGDGLLARCFPLLDSHWNLHEGRAVATFVHSEDTEPDKILWGRVDAKKVVFTKTRRDTSREFITINWPQEEVSRCKGERSQMGGKTASSVSMGLMRSYIMQDIAHDCCLDNILYVTVEQVLWKWLFDRWNQSENQPTTPEYYE